MDKLKELNKSLEKINSIVEAKIFYSTIEDINNIGNFISMIKIDDKIYKIFVDEEKSITNKEKKLIKCIIESLFEEEQNYIDKEEMLINFLKGQENESNVEELLRRFGFDNRKILVLVMKLYGSNDIEEIISTINNIGIGNLIVIETGENFITIIYEYDKEIENLSQVIVGILETELYQKVKVGVSTAKEIVDLKKAYDEALEALTLGLKINEPSNILKYENMLVPRIVSNMPDDLLKKCYENALKNGIDKIDQYELKTAEMFMKSDLNLSETARRLYIHRNTLIYRLDKIKKDTGFDLRTFKDAVNFIFLITIYRYYKVDE